MMERKHKNLYSLIDCNMLKVGHDCGSLLKEKRDDPKEIVYDIAFGMEWLHNYDIIYISDSNALNILVIDTLLWFHY